MFETAETHESKGPLCREILESLPEWFGIPKAIDAYVDGVEGQPMLVCREVPDGAVVGFLSLRFHTSVAAEAYVLGVRRGWHRRGCGTMLFNAATHFARTRGTRFLTVKTLAATNPNPNYRLTRQFYEKIGFLPLEVFPALWGTQNPCLFMIKPL
jgi:ribosomal protein S18 acetylase RimI-like enzyme